MTTRSIGRKRLAVGLAAIVAATGAAYVDGQRPPALRPSAAPPAMAPAATLVVAPDRATGQACDGGDGDRGYGRG